MKVSRLKYIAMGAILGLSFVSCEDFLDRPNEDSYNDGNYFQNDAQTKVSVNTLYNSPWYDFLSRGYYKIPEALSGNLLLGGSPYANFTVNGSDEDMKSLPNQQMDTIKKLAEITCSTPASVYRWINGLNPPAPANIPARNA